MEMLRRLLFILPAICIPVRSSVLCPDGFDLVRDGECRGKYTTLTVMWKDAEKASVAKCQEINGLPIIIHDEEHHLYWCARDVSDHNPVIAIVCNSVTKRWEWEDGSAIDYKPPSYDPKLDQSCVDGCGWFIELSSVWHVWCPTTADYSTDIFCTTQLHPPVPSGDGCDSFDDDKEDGVCYQIGEAAETWQDAQMICRKMGANLASIHNQQENAFLRRLAVSKGAVNGVFLGATMSGKGKDFGWVDGTAWDFENFHPGFPKNGFGDCLAMDTSISSGLWLNMDCTAKLPVACVRDQKIDPAPACSSEDLKEETVITSPGFPYTASKFCDYFLEVEEGKKVELEIIFLEANSCCDSLLIYDGYLGSNVLANLTGELRNVTYTTTSSNIMRVNWQPNGGVSVRGMAMTFRGV